MIINIVFYRTHEKRFRDARLIEDRFRFGIEFYRQTIFVMFNPRRTSRVSIHGL